MRTIMRVSVRMIFGLIVGLSVLGGCASSKTRTGVGDVDNPTGNYRTISAAPLRDTESARRWHAQGLKHLDAGDLEQAEKAFKESLEADVDFGPAHNNLGKVYFKKKDWYAAAWEFEFAKKLMPRQAEPWNNLGMVYEQAGELDRAVEEYRKAVGLDGENVSYQANLARALVRRGDKGDEVRRLLTVVVEKDSRPEWASWAREQLARLGE